MKDQYFGDKNDYIKYALLRRLTRGNEVRTAVCWMLTESDLTRDTRNKHYLDEPFAQLWRRIDKDLFKCLHEAVCDDGERAVRVIERSRLLEGTSFYPSDLTPSDQPPRYLTNILDERRGYFNEFLQWVDNRELVFFDPDTGIHPKYQTYKYSPDPRYLYLSEIRNAYTEDNSLLVYQHRGWGEPIEETVQKLQRKLFKAAAAAGRVHMFYSGDVAFGLVPHTKHGEKFEEQVKGINRDWAGFVHTVSFNRPQVGGGEI